MSVWSQQRDYGNSVTTLCSPGEQKSNSEWNNTLRQMDYNSRRLCQPRTEIQACSGHRISKTGDLKTGKNVGWISIYFTEAADDQNLAWAAWVHWPAWLCFNSPGWILLGMLFWHILVLLLLTVTVWMPVFFLVLLLTVWLAYHLQARIMHQAIKQKSNWFHEHGSQLTRSEVSGTSWGCGWSGESQHEFAADKSADIMWCNHVNMEQSLTQKWNAVSKRSAI